MRHQPEPAADPQQGRGERCCNQPWDFVQIDTDGAVRHCYKAWVQSLGFFDEGFAKIWRGQHYAKIRKTVNSDSPHFLYCAYCSLRKGSEPCAAPYNQHLNEDAYLISGLECYQTQFNERVDENKAAFTERKSNKEPMEHRPNSGKLPQKVRRIT